MKGTKIEWADHTFNPWQGCRGVSPGCKYCYAEALTRRFGRDFRKRERTSPTNWRGPVKWNDGPMGLAQCLHCSHRFPARRGGEEMFCPVCGNPEADEVRPRVFCLSMGDWLDPEVPIEWLADLLATIRRTPELDWLLLTKRPENWQQRLLEVCFFMGGYRDGQMSDGPVAPEKPDGQWIWDWGKEGIAPPNIWIGTSVEDQERADVRIPELLKIPARVRFLSCEPLLGEVDLAGPRLTIWDTPFAHPGSGKRPMINWVICGGESGPKARPMHPDWVRYLRDQCQASGVPFFFKQWGEWLPICFDPPGWESTPNGEDWHQGKRSTVLQLDGREENDFPVGAMTCIKVGKKAAGRMLDGREWNEFPAVKVDSAGTGGEQRSREVKR